MCRTVRGCLWENPEARLLSNRRCGVTLRNGETLAQKSVARQSDSAAAGARRFKGPDTRRRQGLSPSIDFEATHFIVSEGPVSAADMAAKGREITLDEMMQLMMMRR